MSAISQNKAVFQFLKVAAPPITAKQLTQGLSDLDCRIYRFISRLILFFGRHNVAPLSNKLDSTLGAELVKADQVYYEIQTHLGVEYDEENFPWTAQWMRECCPVSFGQEQFFSALQKDVYESLPFLQHARCSSHCDLTQLQQLQAQRIKAVTLFNRCLALPDATLTEDEKLSVTQVVFTAGAMSRNHRPVFYAEALQSWAQKKPAYRQAQERLMKQLEVTHWVAGEQPPGQHAEVSKAITFQEALVDETIKEMQTVFGVSFTPELMAYLSKQLLNETLRIDLEFFLGHLKKARVGASASILSVLEMVMELSWASPESKSFLASLQLYFHVLAFYQAEKGKHQDLLEMLIHRSSSWDLEAFHKWTVDNRLIAGNSFARAWERIHPLQEQMHPKRSDPFLWPLLAFAIQTQDADRFIALFMKISEDMSLISAEPLIPEHFFEVLSLSEAYFADRNSLLTERKEAGNIVIALNQRYSFSILELFSLYLEMVGLHIKKEDHIPRATSQMIHKLESLCGTLGKEEIYYLYRYHPDVSTHSMERLHALKARFLRSNREGFVLDQSLVREIYEGVIAFCRQFASSAAEREDRQAPFISSMQNYCITAFFPPIQPLADSFRICGLSVNEGIRWASSHLVSHLGQYRPLFKGSPLAIYTHWDIVGERPIFFMSCSHLAKRSASSAFIELELPWGGFLHSPRSRRYSGNQTDLIPDKSILSSQAAPVSTSSSSSSSSTAQPKKRSHARSLTVFTSAALIPQQDTRDMKRRALFSYLYTLLPVFNEETSGDQPQAEEQAKVLEGYIGVAEGLAEIMKEYPGYITPEEGKKIWEFVAKVKVTYRKLFLSQTLSSEPDIDWGTQHASKVVNANGARDIMATPTPLPTEKETPFSGLALDPSLTPTQIASQGFIFPTHPRGSLFPNLAEIGRDMEFYIPDAKETAIEALRPHFSQKTDTYRETKVNLTVTDGKQKRIYPISHSVQTLDDLLPAEDDGVSLAGLKKKWDERARPLSELEGGTFVTLEIHERSKIESRPIRIPLFYTKEVLQNASLFWQYFDYHNLILKARCYYEIEYSRKKMLAIEATPNSSSVFIYPQEGRGADDKSEAE